MRLYGKNTTEEEITRTIEREILDFKPRPYNIKDAPIPRKINEFRTGDKFKIGSLEIEPIHVDHSVPGAYGFIIYTSEGPIVYTGDIRLHGTHSEMTRDFISKAKQVKPIALITEGTRIADEAKEESEDKVYKESGKKGNDKEFIDLHNTWTAEQIAARPNKVLCAIGFYSFTALIDMKPKPGALYIHSSSEPYNEEQELSQERIDAWLGHFSMDKFQSHCSGHARGKDLLEAVSEINAKSLYPVHTVHPEAYKKISNNMTIIQEGIQYKV